MFESSGLTNLRLSKYLTEIPGSCFKQCANLASVNIPDSVLKIGASAFYQSGLQTVTMGNNVEEMGSSVFADCNNLSEVTLSSSLDALPSKTFYGCWSLANITLPDGINIIGSQAFYMSGLKSVVLPANLVTIERAAFRETALTSISFPSTLSFIGTRAFQSCAELKTIYFTGNAPQLGYETGHIGIVYDGDGDPHKDEGSFAEVTATVYYPGDNATYQKNVTYNGYVNYGEGAGIGAKPVIQYHGDGYLTWRATATEFNGNKPYSTKDEDEWKKENNIDQGGTDPKPEDPKDPEPTDPEGPEDPNKKDNNTNDNNSTNPEGNNTTKDDGNGEQTDGDAKSGNDREGTASEAITNAGNRGAATQIQNTVQSAASEATAASAVPTRSLNATVLDATDVAQMNKSTVSLRKVLEDNAEEVVNTVAQAAVNLWLLLLILAGLVALGMGVKYTRYRRSLVGGPAGEGSADDNQPNQPSQNP